MKIIFNYILLMLQINNVMPQRVFLKNIKNKLYDFGVGYQALLIQGNASPMGKIDGVSASMGARFINNKLTVGIEFGVCNQPTNSVIKQWPMGNQMATASVNKFTQVFNLGTLFRYYLRNDGIVNYYITGGGGKLFSKSDLWVFDANFEDNCEVIDRRELLRSNNLYGSIGAGFSISTFYFITDEDNDLASYKLDFSCRYFFSGSMNLLNVQSNQQSYNHKHYPLNMQFKDLATNTIHSHEVGKVISGPVNGFQFNISIVFSGVLSRLKLKKDQLP